MAKIMRIAAIDFGLKRIGIALSDDRKKLALPFATVDGGKKGVANTVAALAKKQGEIERILVGLPLLMSGQKSEMAKEVEAFAKALDPLSRCPHPGAEYWRRILRYRRSGWPDRSLRRRK